MVAVLDALRARVSDDARRVDPLRCNHSGYSGHRESAPDLESTDILLDELDQLIGVLANLAEEHAATPMVARTNGQHALPTTLGMRFVRWLAELRRNRERLTQMRPRVEIIQFSGAAGTYASLGEDGPRTARALAESLNLGYEPYPWHAAGDVMAEIACTTAIYAQTLGKIAEDLFTMQRTDMAEAHETMDALLLWLIYDASEAQPVYHHEGLCECAFGSRYGFYDTHPSPRRQMRGIIGNLKSSVTSFLRSSWQPREQHPNSPHCLDGFALTRRVSAPTSTTRACSS